MGVDLEIVILTDSKSHTETQISYRAPYAWNVKNDASELIYQGETDSQMENRLVAKGRQGREGRHGRLGLEDGEYYIEDRETKKQTKKTEKQQYPVINSKGKEYEKEYCIYIYVYV